MPAAGWKQLLAGAPWFRGPGKYRIAAYSEFMPPPRLGRKPYDHFLDPILFDSGDPWGWHITEYEQALELQPGLQNVARQLVTALAHLGRGEAAHGIARNKLRDNPAWPEKLAEQSNKLEHERYVLLAPLALSRTQDDKGRIRWTVFGGSEQGPARGFWGGFFTAPDREVPEEQAVGFFRQLLSLVYGEKAESLTGLRQAGFRILSREKRAPFPFWDDGPVPSWTDPLHWKKSEPLDAVKYLLTFLPFAELPAAVQTAYLQGKLHLLPCPGSLIFWHAPPYEQLQKELPFAVQIPLLQMVARHAGWLGLRVPQSGWLHEPRDGEKPDEHHGPIRNTYKRNHRWARVFRHEDDLAVVAHEEKLAHVLFSTMPDDLGLYGKPMARNVQMWTHEYRLLLDGPHASHDDIEHAIGVVREGGMFGYRFYWPPMQVGRHQVFWHRPLAAYLPPDGQQPALLPEAPLGYLTAYRADRPDLSRPIELWPRLLQREPHLEAVRLFQTKHCRHPYETAINIRKLLDTRRLLGEKPLPTSLARALLSVPRHTTLEAWLEELPKEAADSEGGRRMVETLKEGLQPVASPPAKPKPPPSWTFAYSSRRAFEVAYWKSIAAMAEGRYVNKNNADCIQDPVTAMRLAHHHRDLEALGDYILAHYDRVIQEAGMKGKAQAGELPFVWHTDFDFSWYGGWVHNQEQDSYERDLIAIIPGRDRRRAVIMADHYDTAYMADYYEKDYGGDGARLAAAGADDNHSATAALMLAAPVFLELSKQGKLDCDIWLVHLTGEEFPADCLGARHLCQELVQRTLRVRLSNGRWRDCSKTEIQGVYVLDMVAHNNDHERDIFQMSPGSSPQSMWLAYQAHLANEIWNASAAVWNQKAPRRGRGRGKRSPDGSKIPGLAEHIVLQGEVRPPYDPRSTLYNTDGQIFSDAGVPVVLFMENYDINRTGYHDTHDTMDNIDLDYGAAVAAIAIESVARAAIEKPLK